MKQKGFSLIELLIAVAIIGLLATVAYPAYTGYVQVSRRADAKAVLVTLENKVVNKASDSSGNYQGMAAGGADVGTPAPTLYTIPPALARYYNITINGTAAGFTLTADPINGQETDSCGTLTINSANVRTPAGCW